MTWIPEVTDDGSFTFFSEEFQERFHSSQGAKTEAFEKFAEATELTLKAQQPSVRLLDVCYGLGYNTAAALETIWAVNPNCDIEVIGLELDETVPLAAIAPPLLQNWTPSVQTILHHLATHHVCQLPQLQARLLIGDARQTISTLIAQGFPADAIFFDPFSPRRCPQLWTVEFFERVSRCLSPTGKLATYSRSAAVRSALLIAGLQIGTLPLAGEVRQSHEWSQGTVGSFEPPKHPLSVMELEHLKTRAAIPYRDPTLQDEAAVILARHDQEQQASEMESTSSWRKRWGIK